MQYTVEEIKVMSDAEIAQALAKVIELRHSIYPDGSVRKIIGSGPEKLYVKWEPLQDWSVTGPLMVEYGIGINELKCEVFWIATRDDLFARNKNPLRAVCEVILMIGDKP